jgi:2,3-bisphosphoglycerate-dependent phosphoglycerate mutase
MVQCGRDVDCSNDITRTLWLVRHGESTWNVLGLVQGQMTSPSLTERGRRQSERVAESFRGRPVEAMYASDLDRAQQTAAIVARTLGLHVHSHPSLRERCFGGHEGLPSTALDPRVTGILAQQVVDVHARPDGGESLHELYQRAGAFVEWLDTQPHGGAAVVVTHGGTIRALRAYCAGVPMEETAWETVANGSVWKVKVPASLSLSKFSR